MNINILANIFTPKVLVGEWAKDGACKNAPPEWFFAKFNAGKGNRPEQEKIRAAKFLCNQCPVKQECLDYAIEAGEPDGIWGGMTPRERHEYELKNERKYA